MNLVHSQLERWRTRGLLPRAIVVRDQFGGSRVETHDETVLAAAELLGAVSCRGRAWQVCALELFEAGFDLSTQAVRSAALWLVERQTQPMRQAWQRAMLEATPVDDPGEELADLGELAAKIAGRAVRRVVADEIASAHSFRSQVDLPELADRALTWRIVDIVVPHRLTPEQRNLARHGMNEPMDPLRGIGVLALPSERTAVANTLTWAEANVFRSVALRVRDQMSLDIDLFSLMTWIVTARRLREDPQGLDRPLSQDYLVLEVKELETPDVPPLADTPPTADSVEGSDDL